MNITVIFLAGGKRRNYRRMAIVLFLVAFYFAVSSVWGQDKTDEQIYVGATTESLYVHLPEDIQACRIEAGAVYQDRKDFKVLYDQKPTSDTISLPKWNGKNNLLYQQFLITLDGQQYLRWVTEMDGVSKYHQDVTWPSEVKGVSCPVVIDDLKELGARHTHWNINLSNLLLPEGAENPDREWMLHREGITIRINPDYVRSLDNTISDLTKADVNVVAVILNIVGLPARENNPLIHPDAYITDPEFSHFAVNLSNKKSVVTYTTLMEFLAERYSRPDKRFGQIGGYIIGNEVDSHWTWHNMGPADLDTVAREYLNQVRLSWLAISQAHSDIPVFISLTHSWVRPNSQDPLRSLSGKALLDKLVELSINEGNYPWHIAYHPYPQDLRNPRFWQDDMATFGYDTPMVTFRNLEVLAGYMDKPRNMIQGRSRRLILSEQGFDTPAGPDGEEIQAAAYALSYERIKQIPKIEAYILHRHVDHRGEFGLRLGLWTAKQIPGHMSTPDQKKKLWYVFQAAGTPNWRDEVKFALAILGLDSWDDVYVYKAAIPEHSPDLEYVISDGELVYDFVKEIDSATITDSLEYRTRLFPQADGGVHKGIYLHPQGTPHKGAKIRYELLLPDRKGLEFHTTLYTESGNGDGVVYRLFVNDKLLMEHDSLSNNNSQHASLKAYAGKSVRITLEVDPKTNNSHDWAYWQNPVIVMQK